MLALVNVVQIMLGTLASGSSRSLVPFVILVSVASWASSVCFYGIVRFYSLGILLELELFFCRKLDDKLPMVSVYAYCIFGNYIMWETQEFEKMIEKCYL
ncbi:hypothetical protein I3760_02G188200 [Carya illinoinensis]|nr:hypothetical protein I3760_02G188200 [Carya illinoinensis]